MVMDGGQSQQPSPQSVGREFVRQYYTLLNKAPNHLHRFYNNNSSFIHGESALVVGQKNIHNRIQQLNFNDCHAKISQVDAQATLGNGVVVQVTGELSNDGQPMRRFTQTFVLAAQSPKKYYVHNDIFRYQDLYSDEENDTEARSENDEEHEQQQVPPLQQMGQMVQSVNELQAPIVSEQQQHMPPAQVAAAGTGVVSQQAVYYSVPANAGRPVAVLQPHPAANAVPVGASFTNATGVANVASPQTANINQINGVAHEDLIANMPQTSGFQPTALVNQTTGAVAASPAGVVTVIGGGALPNVPGTTLSQNVGTISTYQQTSMPSHNVLQREQQQQIGNLGAQQAASIQKHSSQVAMAGHNMDLEANNAPITSAATISSNNSMPAEPPAAAARLNTVASVVASGQAAPPGSLSLNESNPTVVDDFKTINEQQQQEKYETSKHHHHHHSEPKTYANLFKSTSSSPSSFVNAAMQQQQQQQQQMHHQQANNMYQPPSSIAASSNYSQSTGTHLPMSSVYGNRNNNNDNSSLRQDNNHGGGGGGGQSSLPPRNNNKPFNKDFDQRRNNSQFVDNQQLFLGNIPHHASEEELKALFARFGNVLDLRILSKSGGKLPPGVRNPLNYGFITYADAESVQNCLAHCPLYFPEDSPDRQKLNVEEKKPRVRTGDMPIRQSMMGGGGGGMNNMNNQRNMNSGGGPSSRSLSNSGNNGGGSMMRGNNVNNMTRGGSTVPRMGQGGFNRNDNRSNNTGSGSQMRSGNNNLQSSGNSYGVRR